MIQGAVLGGQTSYILKRVVTLHSMPEVLKIWTLSPIPELRNKNLSVLKPSVPRCLAEHVLLRGFHGRHQGHRVDEGNPGKVFRDSLGFKKGLGFRVWGLGFRV